MVVLTTKQVLLKEKLIKRNYFNLYGGYRTTLCGSIDTAKWWLYLTKMELYLLMMWLFQPAALLFQPKFELHLC